MRWIRGLIGRVDPSAVCLAGCSGWTHRSLVGAFVGVGSWGNRIREPRRARRRPSFVRRFGVNVGNGWLESDSSSDDDAAYHSESAPGVVCPMFDELFASLS